MERSIGTRGVVKHTYRIHSRELNENKPPPSAGGQLHHNVGRARLRHLYSPTLRLSEQANSVHLALHLDRSGAIERCGRSVHYIG
eukprot:scaffold268274_cov30-Tisochrysis_lutea.AAC.1